MMRDARIGAAVTRLAVAALMGLFGAASASAAGLTIAWNPNGEGNLSGYRVTFGTASGSYSSTVEVNSSVTRIRLENLTAGQRYYVVVHAVNRGGQVSGPSSEVSGLAGTTLPAAPSGAVNTYYAEGAAGFFDYRVALLNTSATETWLNVSFLREGAAPVQRSYSI